MRRSFFFVVFLLCACFLLTACKSSEIYNEREKEILAEIEQTLLAFGIEDATEFKIINKGTIGETFNPHALSYTFRYTGDNALPFESNVSIDYDDAEKGKIEPAYIAEDYAKVYFEEQLPDVYPVVKVLMKYYDASDISVSHWPYPDFMDATNHLAGADHVRQVETLVDRWMEMTKYIIPEYNIRIEKEHFTPEEHEAILYQLKDELPVGKYDIIVEVKEEWEEWKATIYATD